MIHATSTRFLASIRPAALRLAGAITARLWVAPALANPEGGQVVGGTATITQTDPKTLTINQTTNKAIINWRNFSIKAGEHTTFVQPSAMSAVLNRVTSGQVSQTTDLRQDHLRH